MKQTSKKRAIATPKQKAKPTPKSADVILKQNKKRMYGIAVEQQTFAQAEKDPRPRNLTKLTAEKKTEFIAHLLDGLTVVDAAAKIGFDRTVTLYDHRKRDVEFAAAWDQAWKDGADALEKEAQRRACLGVTEPVFYKGEVVGSLQKYSDVLLIFLLKGRRPDRFRENVDLTNSDNSIANAFAAAIRKAAT